VSQWRRTLIVLTIPQVKEETNPTQTGILKRKEVPGALQRRNLCFCRGKIQFDK